MFLLEEVANDMRLSLAPVQVTAHAGHHFHAIARATLPQGIGIHVLVEKLVGVQFRAVARHADQTQLLGVRLGKLFGKNRAVHGVTVNDQVDYARRLFEQSLQGKRVR